VTIPIRRRLRHAVLPAAALAALLAAPRASFTAASPEEADGFVPLGSVRPGMSVVVRTVLSGETVEEIPAEIIGVMENALGPAQSLILARLTGERASFTGVAAGMSGSPVYAGGRLVGALSYRVGQFTKEPIAGITPIEYMLELAKLPAPREPSAVARHGGGRAESGGSLPERLIPLVTGPAAPGAPSAGSSLVPIEAPLVVTGIPPEVLGAFRDRFAELGAVPVAGAGGSLAADGDGGRPIRPGDAIAAQLVRGDISIAATGTVTHVAGDRVLAFGHPFLMSGAADIPMARAEIYMTLASLAGSTKISRVRETVGAWEQTRLPGISGVTSRTPPMIPMSVTVKSPLGSAAYAYEVATHRDWSPVLVSVSVAASLVNTPAFTDESTLSVSGRFRLKGHPDVVLHDLYTGLGQGSSAALDVASDVQSILGAVFQNRFEAPKVTSIELSAEGVEEGRLAFVEGVWPSRAEASPGEEVVYHVRLRGYRGGSETRALTFKVPEGIPRGDLTVHVGGASHLLAAERQLLGRRLAGADSLDQIIEIVNQLRASDALYGKAVRRLSGAVVQSAVLPALPPSILTTLRANRGSGEVAALTETVAWEEKLPMDAIVLGGSTLTLKIR
jgi:hypothetical protein